MPLSLERQRLQAVIFDWAGTVIDHGSLAPMGVFVEAFKRFGVEISIDEARGPMGMAKRDHIKALMAAPRIAAAWAEARGGAPTEADIDAVYEVFVPMNVAVVTDFATLIDGAAETVAALRQRGLKIGTTTGYTRDIMARLTGPAAEQGFAPDSMVCAGDLAEGRPGAMMMWRTFQELNIWPAWTAVKVDDTEVGIEEGLNAGCWTVGVALSGNSFGFNKEQTAALDHETFETRSAAAYTKLTRAGAHYVIDDVSELLPVIDGIEGALARGERP